jgi:hypothetical protein
MKEKDREDLVPVNETGVQSNTESSVELGSEEEAKSFYMVVKGRLMNVNKWQEFAGAATASFQLTDALGNEVNREVATGDHFKIDIPGPGPATGDGFDWVQVELAEEEKNEEHDMFTIRVRPATNPLNDRQDVAHFFSQDATSSFMVRRKGNKVTAAVYGRNEKPNTHAEKVVDNIRNATVGTGAVSGFSKLQWKSLVTGLTKKP